MLQIPISVYVGKVLLFVMDVLFKVTCRAQKISPQTMFFGGFSVLNFNEKLKREHRMLTWFCTQLWKSSCRLSEVKSLSLKLLCFAPSKFSLSALTSCLPTLTSHCSLFLSASLCPALSPPLPACHSCPLFPLKARSQL